jgi:hypothetical protein
MRTIRLAIFERSSIAPIFGLAAMLVKINRQDCISKYPNLPLRVYNFKEEEYDYYYPKIFANYILTLTSKSYKGHMRLLGTELTSLITNFGYDKLIFLGDEKTPWLYRDHDYKPAKEGLQYLKDNKIGKRFNGALQVDTTQLPTFIKHFAWLVRSNAVLPYIHFIDLGQNIIGDICQYGNLHISLKNKKVDTFFKEVISKSKFEYLTDGNCYNKFSKSSAIKGRQSTV